MSGSTKTTVKMVSNWLWTSKIMKSSKMELWHFETTKYNKKTINQCLIDVYELYGSNRIRWFNVRSVVQKRRELLQKLNKASFHQNEGYHLIKFSEVFLFLVRLMRIKMYDVNRSLCFIFRGVAQKQRQMLEKLKKARFLKIRFTILMSLLRLWFW